MSAGAWPCGTVISSSWATVSNCSRYSDQRPALWDLYIPPGLHLCLLKELSLLWVVEWSEPFFSTERNNFLGHCIIKAGRNDCRWLFRMFVCTILCDLENFSSCLLELVLVTRFLPLHSSCQSGLQSVAVYPISATPRFWLISLNYKSPLPACSMLYPFNI